MGFDRRFALALIGWIAALFAALGCLAAAIATPDFAAVRVVAGLLAVGAAFGLIRHIDRTNRTLARFVEALRFGEFATRFDGRGGAGFATLGQSLDEAMRKLQAQRDQTAEGRHFLEALIDDVPVALLTVDAARGVTLVNKAARRQFVLHEGQRPTDFAVYGETFAAHLADGTERPAELLILRTAAGPQRAIVRTATLERLGLRTRAVTVEPVQGTLDAIEMAAQTDLVRVLTHEILNSLTPVMSLAGTVATILDDDAPDIGTMRTAMGTLARRTESLEHFIRSYRAVAHVPEVRRQTFLAEPFAGDMAQLFAAEWPDLTLESAVTPGVVLDADPDLLAQAIINLLRNAAQATRDAAGSNRVRLDFTGSAGKVTRIVVADSGSGVPEAFRNDIFLPFFSTREHGTGVGLNLVRQIVVAHGWNIGLSDAPGGGATFSIFVG